ncbi:MAG TPA: hypothetical protein VKZ18_00650 [Polyangia bacterium]|nr:hypothetical protein [Polyangia bacterium]
MFNSTVLDVALGLVFCWGAVALIASSVYEAIASMLKLRANDLLDGVKELLNDKDFTGLAQAVYRSALVNPRDPGTAQGQGQLTAKPSYIDPMQFAQALIEAIQGAPDAAAELKAKIDALPDKQLQAMLLGMYARAGGKVEELQRQLASWYSAAMERVSGVYKRKAQLFSFLIALLVAGVLNIDSIHLCSALWGHPADVAGLATAPDTTKALQDLRQLPIGWVVQAAPDAQGGPAQLRTAAFGPLTLLGWLATACSALFGAPFWFGLLQRLVNVRGAGPKPAAEKA